MEVAELILEVVKYILPALLVVGAVYMVLQSEQKKQSTKERWEIQSMSLSKVIPLRLQAYERALLFLERISPENLIMRVDGRGKDARFFLSQIQMEIRAEYEHNLAQQLYISPAAWEELVKAKDSVLSLVNTVGGSLPADSTGMDLSKKVLEMVMAVETIPTQRAILFLKKDIQKSFRLIS